MKNKILMITPFFSPNLGGVETFLDDLIRYLHKKDQNVDVVTYQPITAKTRVSVVEKTKGDVYFRIPWIRFNLFYHLESKPLLQLIYLGTGVGFFSFFHLIFNSKKYNTINGHGLAAGFVMYILSFIFRKRYVLTLHTNYRFAKGGFVGKFVKKMIKRFDEVLVLSYACRDDLIKLGVSKEKIKAYFNWIDRSMYEIENKNEARKKIGWDDDKFYALFVGRFSKEKGIFDLLESIPHVNNGVNIAIIGGGGVEEDRVSGVAKENKNVHYLGRKKPEELKDYFNAADILVYAPVDEDYLGRVAISALYCGTPIMIPNESFYGGERTKVILKLPKDVGVIFENNPEGFARKLNELYENRNDGMFDKSACEKFVDSVYGEEVNGNIFYKSLIG